ncbi:phage head-tail joining protein [Falsiroseomonas oryzae]|uniref:phage head-tail joining protein n=1 Tax=Falsiroseomonas oryzae TaxID=2766473 RepID=UPI0038CC0D31
MEPTILAWALAQPSGSRAAALAAAYTGGVTRVTFDGRTVAYRGLHELGRALAVLRGAETAAARAVSPSRWPASRGREAGDPTPSRCLAGAARL